MRIKFSARRPGTNIAYSIEHVVKEPKHNILQMEADAAAAVGYTEITKMEVICD
jgi:hypothetical protein